jgi:hypothetical protein
VFPMLHVSLDFSFIIALSVFSTRIFIGYRGLSNLQLTCLKECYIPTPNALVCKQYGWPRYFRQSIWRWRWRPI